MKRVLIIAAMGVLGVISALVISGCGENKPTAVGTVCAHVTIKAGSAEGTNSACVEFPSGNTVSTGGGATTTRPPTPTRPPPGETTTTVPITTDGSTEEGTTTIPIETNVPPPADFDPGPKAPYPTVSGTCTDGNDGTNGKPKTGIISCFNRPVYLEQQNYDLDLVQVKVTANAPDNAKKAIYLRQGSGHIEWVRVQSDLCDAMIGGLHDFTIEHLRIQNNDASNLDCHNDGVQINSSINVLIKDYYFAGTGHSAAFIGAGSDGFPGRNVVFDGGCWGDTEPVEGKPNHRSLDVGISIAESDASGVRNVTIEPVKQHEIYVPQTPSSGGGPATNPIIAPNTLPTSNNVCPDPIPAGY